MSETVRIHTKIWFDARSIAGLKIALKSLLEHDERNEAQIERLRARILEQESLLTRGQSAVSKKPLLPQPRLARSCVA